MKALKPVVKKRSAKQEREHQVLLGVVEHYLKTGKPVGSNTLKDTCFKDLSSATIRNYFAHLEKEGYLSQQHASGGRIPTESAYRLYAQEVADTEEIDPPTQERLEKLRTDDKKGIATFLQKAAEELSSITNTAVFLSAPRFDRDFILDIKVVGIDANRCLCVLITDFGLIRTEVLHTEEKLSTFSLKRLEDYFHWRLRGHSKPEMEKEEEELAQTFYNEVIVRYIVGYAHFIDEEVYRTGFSNLLNYPEFSDAGSISQGLSLFENAHGIRLLLKECSTKNTLVYWIGDELATVSSGAANCTAVAIPYYINNVVVGAIGVLGPMRLPYKELFAVMRTFSTAVSEALTRNVYKYHITYRTPQEESFLLEQEGQQIIGQSSLMLLEDKGRYLGL